MKLSFLLVSTVLAQSICKDSNNEDTNSVTECKYLSPCTWDEVPDEPTGYSIECESECTSSTDIQFDRIEGTDITPDLLPASCDNTVVQCAAECEKRNGCCGFNFVFNPGQYNSQQIGRCVGKACDGRIGTSRYGMVYYERDAGAVYLSPCHEATGDTTAVCSNSTCTQSDLSAPTPAGYLATLNIELDGKDLGASDASCSATIAECAAACEQEDECCGFSFFFGVNFGDNSNTVPLGRCIAKGCSASGTAANGVVSYQRIDGAVRLPRCDEYACQDCVSPNTDCNVLRSNADTIIGADDATCCEKPLCANYTCQGVGYTLKENANLIGSSDSSCCSAPSDTCDKYTCQIAGLELKANASSIVGGTDQLCCEVPLLDSAEMARANGALAVGVLAAIIMN